MGQPQKHLGGSGEVLARRRHESHSPPLEVPKLGWMTLVQPPLLLYRVRTVDRHDPGLLLLPCSHPDLTTKNDDRIVREAWDWEVDSRRSEDSKSTVGKSPVGRRSHRSKSINFNLTTCQRVRSQLTFFGHGGSDGEETSQSTKPRSKQNAHVTKHIILTAHSHRLHHVWHLPGVAGLGP